MGLVKAVVQQEFFHSAVEIEHVFNELTHAWIPIRHTGPQHKDDALVNHFPLQFDQDDWSDILPAPAKQPRGARPEKSAWFSKCKADHRRSDHSDHRDLMAWMRTVGGRLESRYQYSIKLVYNNFPWPQDVTDSKREKVESAAQHVLDVRTEFPDATLADLYDPLSMPPKLAKAHTALDKAVDLCYRSQPFPTERHRIEYLFELYQQLTKPLMAKPKKPRAKKAT